MSRGWLQHHRSYCEKQKGKQSYRKAIEFEILNLRYQWSNRIYSICSQNTKLLKCYWRSRKIYKAVNIKAKMIPLQEYI